MSQANAVTLTADGGFLLAGGTNLYENFGSGAGPARRNGFLVKTDGEGKLMAE